MKQTASVMIKTSHLR